MKKIQTKKEKEKKQKLNNILIGTVMIVILTLATAGYSLITRTSETQTQKTEEYNGFEFIRSEPFWITKISDKNFAFTHLPNEIQDVEIDISKSLADYYNKPLYTVNEGNMLYILLADLSENDFVLRIVPSCEETRNCTSENLPTKSCLSDNMIIYEDSESDITSVTQVGNCVIIKGDKSKGTDKLITHLLNIK